MFHFPKIINIKTKTGFTLLEVVIVMALMGIVLRIVFSGLYGFRNTSILLAGTEDVVSLMMMARSDALSSKDDSVYGVHFETTQVVLFKGSTYVSGDPNNRPVVLDQRLNATDISLNGGGSDVVFNRLTGKSSQYGTVKIVVVGATTTFKIITIYSTGLVDVN
jgi:prepilin-type N-terminal cleavage/methylation domain-containing protein